MLVDNAAWHGGKDGVLLFADRLIPVTSRWNESTSQLEMLLLLGSE